MRLKTMKHAIMALVLALGMLGGAGAFAAELVGDASVGDDHLMSVSGTRVVRSGDKVVLKSFTQTLRCDGTDKIVWAKAVTAAGSSSQVNQNGTASYANVTFTNAPIANGLVLKQSCPPGKLTPSATLEVPVTLEYLCKKSSGAQVLKQMIVKFAVRTKCDQLPPHPATRKAVGFQYTCPDGFQAKDPQGRWSRIIYSEDPNMGWANPAVCHKK